MTAWMITEPRRFFEEGSDGEQAGGVPQLRSGRPGEKRRLWRPHARPYMSGISKRLNVPTTSNSSDTSKYKKFIEIKRFRLEWS